MPRQKPGFFFWQEEIPIHNDIIDYFAMLALMAAQAVADLKEQNTKIESEKTENNKSIETDEKNSTTIEDKKTSLDDLSPKSKKFAKIYNAVRFLVIIAAGVALIYASYSLT